MRTSVSLRAGSKMDTDHVETVLEDHAGSEVRDRLKDIGRSMAITRTSNFLSPTLQTIQRWDCFRDEILFPSIQFAYYGY